MAQASKKSRRLLHIENNGWDPHLYIANFHGIKHEVVPPGKNILDFTYFVLPRLRDDLTAMKYQNHGINDFVTFWLQVPDIHKERRLLVDVLCMMKDEFSGPAFVDCFWKLRQLFIEDQHSSQYPYVFGRFVATLVETSDVVDYMVFLKEFFPSGVKILMESEKKRSCSCCVDKMFKSLIRMVKLSFGGFIEMHSGWMTVSATTPIESSKKHYLDKLRASVPHWSVKDRAMVLEAIGSDGDQFKGSYIEKLIELVGLDQFKKIAFGKERFCSSCHQSSYTAKDRLWSCKHCVREKVRPKARYCNIECQTAHWIQHKAEVHPVQTCAKCGEKPSTGKKLRDCKRCVKEKIDYPAGYCSVECQQADWPDHKAKAHEKAKDF